jgi:hypothetical protein
MSDILCPFFKVPAFTARSHDRRRERHRRHDRIDNRDAKRLLESATQRAEFRATDHCRRCAVLVAQSAPSRMKTLEYRVLPGGASGQRALAGQKSVETRLAQRASAAGNRGRRHRNDAEIVGAGKSGERRTTSDAKNRRLRDLTTGVEARIAVAGDDHDVSRFLSDESAQRDRGGVDVGVGRDERRAAGHGFADDMEPMRVVWFEVRRNAVRHSGMCGGIDDEDSFLLHVPLLRWPAPTPGGRARRRRRT